MSDFRRFILLAGAVFSLSACTSVQELAQQVVDDVRGGSTFGFAKPEPAHKTLPEEQSQMLGYMSNESVEIYGFDDQEGDQPSYATQSQYNHKKALAYQEAIERQYYEQQEREAYRQTPPRQRIEPYAAQAADEPSVMVYPIEGSNMGHYQVMNEAPPVAPYQPYDVTPMPAAMPSTYTPSPQPQYGYGGGLPPSSAGNPARIYYNHGATSLNKTGRQVVGNVAQSYRTSPGTPIRVEGYASERAQVNDPVQRKILNLKTSMDRAINVSQELIKDGVPAESISTIAYGDTRPAAAAGNYSVEDASRRVEINY